MPVTHPIQLVVARSARLLPGLAVAAILLQPFPVLATPAATPGPTFEGRLQTLTKAVEAERLRLHIPGLSLVVVQGDTVVLAKGFGYKDLEGKRSVTPHTSFAIGSATKAFTALSAEMAAEAGKLSLDDAPRAYLPYFHLADPEANAKVTLRDLLCHRTGVDRADLPMISGALSAEEMIRLVGDIKPVSPFRQAFHYQNTMVAAAGFATAAAMGRPWEELITQQILRPLGMTDASTNIWALGASPDAAYGYNLTPAGGVSGVPYRDIGHSAPAGSINASAVDMGHWLRLWLNDGKVDGRQFVPLSRLQEMTRVHTPITPTMGYGLCWLVDTWQGHRTVHHNGSIDGFNSEVSWMPDQKLGFALLTNVSGSPLTSTVDELVWSSLVGGETPVNATASDAVPQPLRADAPAAAELLGHFQDAQKRLDVTITGHEGTVCAIVPGQPPYGLIPQGRDRFSLKGLPGSYGLIVQRGPNQAITGLLLKQPQGDLPLVLAQPYVAPLSVEALMAQVVTATGGEAALRRHRTLVTTENATLAKEGVSARVVTCHQAPFSFASDIELRAFDRTIGRMRETFDGQVAQASSSFSRPEPKDKGEIAETRMQGDFRFPLDWQSFYKQTQIVGTEKVGNEDTYVVAFTPAGGNAVKAYFSTKTFLMLRRDHMAVKGTISIPITTTFRDYRPVDGVMLPFVSTQLSPLTGTVETRLIDATFDVPVPAGTFQAGRLQ